jgi:hypothetical protein
MRYEQILAKDSYTKVDVAAVWPVGIQLVPLPIVEGEEAKQAEAFMPTPAAPDVPAAVGMLIASSYALLLGTFALATIASAYSVYMITISALFMVAFFAIPWLFLRQEPGKGVRPSFDRFMRDGMQTMTGHSTGGAALVQMLVVPVMLTFGVMLMAIAAATIF